MESSPISIDLKPKQLIQDFSEENFEIIYQIFFFLKDL